jgi:hypothetical protein
MFEIKDLQLYRINYDNQTLMVQDQGVHPCSRYAHALCKLGRSKDKGNFY